MPLTLVQKQISKNAEVATSDLGSILTIAFTSGLWNISQLFACLVVSRAK